MKHLINKWGEHIEHAEHPHEVIIDILLNTIISQSNEIDFLKKLRVTQ